MEAKTCNKWVKSIVDVIKNVDRKILGMAILTPAALFFIHKLAKRQPRSKFPDLAYNHWLWGHPRLDHMPNINCTGELFRLLWVNMCKQTDAAYIQPSFSQKILVLFKFQQLKELFLTNGKKSVARNGKMRLQMDFIPVNGILEISGSLWKENRKVFHSFMRSFGKERQLELVIDEAKHFVKALKNQNGEFNPNALSQMAVSNVIATLIFGTRFEYYDPEAQKILSSLFVANSHFEILNWVLWNLFWYVPFLSKSFTKRKNAVLATKKYIREKINQGLQQGFADPPDTMIDAYGRDLQPGSLTDLANLEGVVYEMLFAGTETTSTTLAWFFASMAVYPRFQDKIHEEIESVLGGEDLTYERLSKLQYTIALQHEVQRFSGVVQTTIGHKMNEDYQFSSGETIEKGDPVFASVYNIMRDPQFFQFPEDFNPDNFMDVNGKYKPNEAFVPYGIGPRVCLGQSVADLELKVFMIEVVRQLRISTSESVNLNDRVQRITSAPKDRKYKFTPR